MPMTRRANGVAAVTDSSGTVVASYTYDAFGALTSSSENFPNGWSNPFRYDGVQGVRYDTETGLYWMSVRAYDPTLGRFISHDPLGRLAAMGLNMQPYTYAGNNPVNNTDPSGMLIFAGPGSGGTAMTTMVTAAKRSVAAAKRSVSVKHRSSGRPKLTLRASIPPPPPSDDEVTNALADSFDCDSAFVLYLKGELFWGNRLDVCGSFYSGPMVKIESCYATIASVWMDAGASATLNSDHSLSVTNSWEFNSTLELGFSFPKAYILPTINVSSSQTTGHSVTEENSISAQCPFTNNLNHRAAGVLQVLTTLYQVHTYFHNRQNGRDYDVGTSLVSIYTPNAYNCTLFDPQASEGGH